MKIILVSKSNQKFADILKCYCVNIYTKDHKNMLFLATFEFWLFFFLPFFICFMYGIIFFPYFMRFPFFSLKEWCFFLQKITFFHCLFTDIKWEIVSLSKRFTGGGRTLNHIFWNIICKNVLKNLHYTSFLNDLWYRQNDFLQIIVIIMNRWIIKC